MTHTKEWFEQGKRNGWVMPEAPLWKRLPIIRHIRAIWNSYQVARWYSMVPGIPTGYDEWVLYGMFHGLERNR